MKHYTDKELSAILSDMAHGNYYCGIDKYNRGIGAIWLNGGYIHFRHYGESAVKETIKDLRFIIEVIFSDCEMITDCIWSDYHINYIPKSDDFVGVDLSAQHPNVCGL